MRHLCFVCQGNICRSPMAEGVFKHLAAQTGRADEFQIQSAGVGAWHLGQAPDRRAQRAALAHGLLLAGAAQLFTPRDFESLDLVLALDGEVAELLGRMAAGDGERRKVRLLREFDPEAHGDLDVPDPYYGSAADFEQVYQIVERSCRQLLDSLTTAATD